MVVLKEFFKNKWFWVIKLRKGKTADDKSTQNFLVSYMRGSRKFCQRGSSHLGCANQNKIFWKSRNRKISRRQKLANFPSFLHARIKKILTERVQLWQRFLLLFLMRAERIQIEQKRVIIGPSAKRYLNDISLAGRRWPNIEFWLGRFVNFSGDLDQYC